MRVAARASEQVRDRGERRGQHPRWWLARVERADPRGLEGGEFAVGRGDRREELLRLALEPVGLRVAPAAPRPPGGRLDLQVQGAVGGEAPGAERVDRAYRFDAKPAAGALVGQRGVDVTVEQH